MGVLACNRVGCRNIMCDRYSSEFGYICRECFDELEAANPLDIERFIDTAKPKPSSIVMDYGAIFKIDD